VSRDCCIRSEEPATSFERSLKDISRRAQMRVSTVFDRLPIRTRLAGVSALLTFVILCAFSLMVGSLTVHRIRSDFNRQVQDAAIQLPSELTISAAPFRITPPLSDFASNQNHVVIRILSLGGAVLAQSPTKAPSFGLPQEAARNILGYRVISRPGVVLQNGEPFGRVIIEYGRRLSDTEATIHRFELLLLLGVLAGSGFALLAGAMIARRAMQPITELTQTAEQIARTRDPSRTMPQPAADDEVGELAHTLSGMLRALDDAQAETEATLARQRQFVADASHELRTPLTSVLANLELLAESLHGEAGEAASSALRSSQRMRRLVADLLLLARSDVGRVVPRQPVDLALVVVEATAELGPVSGEHEITVDVQPAVVQSAQDEIFRLTLNLLENAVRHTPPGTQIRVSTTTEGQHATLVVEDDGPGVPEHLQTSLFERFVRGAGDRGGSFGLGLAIVRAVAESHGGSVSLQSPLDQRSASAQNLERPGTRFVVRFPAAEGLDLHDDRQHHRPAAQAIVD
jgi:two-component system, OmpR family, sensor kinase